MQPQELSYTNQAGTNQSCGTGGLFHVMKPASRRGLIDFTEVYQMCPESGQIFVN